MSDDRIDFFIAGVQKGGTTALHAKLSQHPDIFLSEKKELHFFDRDSVDWNAPSYAGLHSHFDFNDGHVRGEATPIYTYWPNSIERIHTYNPDAKIIITLRHPTFRAISAWKMERKRGKERFSFDFATSALGRLRVKFAGGGKHRVFSYVERGAYAAQVAHVLKHFPRSQVFFITSDQLWIEERETLMNLCSFLAVDPEFFSKASTGEKYVVPVESSHMAMDDRNVISRLNKHFKDDIRKCAELTGLDLNTWLDDDYMEPMRAG